MVEIDKIKLTDIKKAEYNPRTISEENYAKLKNSVKNFGLVEPILINLKNNTIISGHQRYDVLTDLILTDGNLAEKEFHLLKYGDLGLILDTDEPTLENEDYEKALNITLNNTNLTGEYNFEKLGELLDELNLSDFDLSLTGFEDMDFDLEGFDWEQEETQFNDNPMEVSEDDFQIDGEIEIQVEKGNLYKLGNHYLLCEDSTKKENVEKLITVNGKIPFEKVDISFTSPPYNVGNGGIKTKNNGGFKYRDFEDNLSQEDYANFLNNYLINAMYCSKYSFVNLQILSTNKKGIIEWLYHNKDYFADVIVWDKIYPVPAISKNVMNKVFELVFVFSEKANTSIGTIPYQSTVDNLIRIKRQYSNEFSDFHNATFPMEFASHFLQNFAEETVLDLFGGTGTTLICAEQLNKKCYMMELSPLYCQIIINRWEELTGEKAEKIN